MRDGEHVISRICDVVHELSEWFDQARQEEASEQCIAALGSILAFDQERVPGVLSPTSANGGSVRCLLTLPSYKSSWCPCSRSGAPQMFATPCDNRTWTSRTWRRSLLRKRVWVLHSAPHECLGEGTLKRQREWLRVVWRVASVH